MALLDLVSTASDRYLPFPDNVEHAHRCGVRLIGAPAGSISDAEVVEAPVGTRSPWSTPPRRYFHH